MRATVLAALVGSVHGVVEARPCARIDKGASSVWFDALNEQKKFVFRVHVLDWQPFSTITLDWGNDEVSLENMYDARPTDDYGGSGPLSVELGPAPSEMNTFLMMGSGTNNLNPEITCE